MNAERIPIKTRAEIDTMREAGRHVAEILLELREMIEPGITTLELDTHARSCIRTSAVQASAA